MNESFDDVRRRSHAAGVQLRSVKVWIDNLKVRWYNGGEHALVVRGGSICDGSGAPRFTGDVAVGHDGRIAAIGQGLGAGEREIDAAGKLVTP